MQECDGNPSYLVSSSTLLRWLIHTSSTAAPRSYYTVLAHSVTLCVELCCGFLMCISDICCDALRYFCMAVWIIHAAAAAWLCACCKVLKSFQIDTCGAHSAVFKNNKVCWCVCPQIQSVSQEPDSPSVTLVYVVKNQDAILNGTISSSLLNQLTAELVGYFLFYPPLVIAERTYRNSPFGYVCSYRLQRSSRSLSLLTLL